MRFLILEGLAEHTERLWFGQVQLEGHDDAAKLFNQFLKPVSVPPNRPYFIYSFFTEFFYESVSQAACCSGQDRNVFD